MKKLSLFLILIFTLNLVGCSTQKNNKDSSPSISTTHTTKERNQTKMTNLKITINEKTLNAQLNSTSAAKDLKKELPTTLTFTSFMGNPEKMADLNHSLSIKGMPKGDEGKAGEIGYWSPDQRIIFYYGHVDYYPGIHIIGKFTSENYSPVISKMKDNTKVKIELN